MGSANGVFEVQQVMYNRPRQMTMLVGKVIHGCVEIGDWVIVPGHQPAEKVVSMCDEKDNLINEADGTKIQVVLAFRGIFDPFEHPAVKLPFNIRLSGRW